MKTKLASWQLQDFSLRWRHNELDGVSDHQPHDCLLNRLFGCRSKKTSKLRVAGLCAGNSPGTGEFPAQMASNAENVSIWWRHHVCFGSLRVIDGPGWCHIQYNWWRLEDVCGLGYYEMSCQETPLRAPALCVKNLTFVLVVALPSWRHQMETFSALLALCVGNSPVTGEFPSQRPVTQSFDVFFDLRLE